MCTETGLYVYLASGFVILVATAYQWSALLYLTGVVFILWNGYKLLQPETKGDARRTAFGKWCKSTNDGSARTYCQA